MLCGLVISVIKTKFLAFKGYFPVRCKLVVNDQVIEQVGLHSLSFPGCDLSCVGDLDVDKKKEKFNDMCGMIRRTLNGKPRRDILLKFIK